MSEIDEEGKKSYYKMPVDVVLKDLNTDLETGITTTEANYRLDKFGYNELPKVKRSFYKLYIAPFFENTLIIIYLIAAAVMLIFSEINFALNPENGRSFSPYITFVVVIFNAVTAIIQQVRAQKSLNALKKLSKEEATVIRNGIKMKVESKLIVPGDILDLQEGDIITADARVIVANNLFTNESSITGESIPVNKIADIVEEESVDIPDMKNIVFRGTFVTKGNGRAIVYSTGGNTEIGKISKDLSMIADQEVPLKRKINRFANYLGIVVGIMFVISWIYTLISSAVLGTGNFFQDLVNSIDLALKFIPINIVLLSTIILITGVLAMAVKGVIVRNLTSIESLGRASVICTDKTGTLTRNEMTVQHIWANGKIFDVSGTGYSKDGSIYLNGRQITKDDYKSLRSLVISGLMNNNAEIVEETRKVYGKKEKLTIVRKIIGDPMEAALDVLAEKLMISEAELLGQMDFVKEYPFDSEIKRMTKIWKDNNKDFGAEWVAFVKGATEVMVQLSKFILGEEKEPIALSTQQKDYIIEEVNKWASEGFRTLGIAYKPLKAMPEGQEYERDVVESDLVFLGFVIIQDPPREGVKEAIEACESAGVTVVMITGDSPVTGAAIGKELGIYDEGETVVEGSVIKDLDDETFMNTAVFARVSPDDKQVIVKRYQDDSRVVVMTGDGVNDALALGMADVGLAMGLSGTDVAKEAADMIISDDSFNTIELGIREGRGLFAKIRVMIYFFVYANLTEAILLFATSFIPKGFRLFETALQIQLIYLLPHSLPPLGLSFDRTARDIMEEKPRDEEEIFNKNILKMMILHIIILGSALLFASLPIISAYSENPALQGSANTDDIIALNRAMARPRTTALVVIFLIEVSTVFSIRRPNIPVHKSFRSDMSPLLLVFVALTFVALFLVIYIPALAELFFLEPLSASDWAFALLLSGPAVPLIELFKWYIRKKGGRF
ncbi:MAG: cation-translocating P-type ATPase [Promethearchaeota archaeon]